MGQIEASCAASLDIGHYQPSPFDLIEREDQNTEGEVVWQHYKAILEEELSLRVPPSEWPRELTMALFSKWFTFKYHESIYNLGAEKLEAYDTSMDKAPK